MKVMSYLLSDLANQLKTAGKITNIGTDCFYDIWPDIKNCYMLEETDTIETLADTIFKRNIKIWYRNINHATAKANLLSIQSYLKLPSDGGTILINNRTALIKIITHTRFMFQLRDCFYFLLELCITTGIDN